MSNRTVLVDAKGEVCPYPAMYAAALLEGMAQGEILEVMVDHLCAVGGSQRR